MKVGKLYNAFKLSTGVSTDTRAIRKGSMFFALKGERFNGNLFVGQAFENGAQYAVVDEARGVINNNCINVDSSLEMLQKLAQYHRAKYSVPMLAITGSNGKTTTKELIISILNKKFNTHYTRGNLNNHIGLPLTLLDLNEHHHISVVEMGANHQGEIARLAELADPDYGLITNIGKAHLEGFGGIEGVIKGKTELFRCLKAKNRPVFVDEKDPILIQHSQEMVNIPYGAQSLQVEMVSEFPTLSFQWKKNSINTHLAGKYNMQNICAAIAVGNYFNVPEKDICNAVESYIPQNSRSQVVKHKPNTIILDAYNANPTSVAAALDNLYRYPSSHKSKMAALGDMLELGEESDKHHQETVNELKRYDFDRVLLVGSCFSRVKVPEDFHVFNNVEEASQWIEDQPVEDSVILIKGSRGIRMEKVFHAITGEKDT